jgi:hypothetical protein
MWWLALAQKLAAPLQATQQQLLLPLLVAMTINHLHLQMQ